MRTWYGAIVVAYKTNPIRILLVENKKTGNITPISGATENNETQIETAIRELKEEVGWIISPQQLRGTSLNHEFIYGSNKAERVGDKGSNKIFLLNADNLPEPKETNDTKFPRWLDYPDVISNISFPDLQEIIKQALEVLV